MVGGHQKPVRGTERANEISNGRIQVFQRRQPVRRLEPVCVRGGVEFGHIDIDQRRRSGERLLGSREAVCDGAPGAIVSTPQHRPRETRLSVAGRADRDRRKACGIRDLEQCGHALPVGGHRPVIPPRQLVDHPVVDGIESRVPDQPVLAGQPTGRERGQARSGGRREHGRDGAIDSEARCERASMTGPRSQCGGTQAIHQQHNGVRDRQKAQRSATSVKRFEAIRDDVGQAEPV